MKNKNLITKSKATGKLTAKILAGITCLSLLFSLLIIPFKAVEAGLCDDFARGSKFINCSSDQTSFVDFQGGLQKPDKQGYSPELTQASSAREFILQATNYVLGFLGLAAVLAIVYGGILYVTAGGEQERADKGKKNITYSVIGLLIVMSSWAIVRTVIEIPSGQENASIATSNQGGTNSSSSRNFNVVARQIQSITREYISSYEKYLELQESIATYENTSEAPQLNSTSELRSYMQQKQQLLRNIETRAESLGSLQEIARTNRLIVQQFTQQAIAALDQKVQSGKQGFDLGNILFGVFDAGAGILEALGGLIGVNPNATGGISQDSKARTNRQTIAKIANNINLNEANLSDFQIEVEAHLINLGKTVSPIAGGQELYKLNPTTQPLYSQEFESLTRNTPEIQLNFLYSKDKKTQQTITYKKPTVQLPGSFASTNVGQKFKVAFEKIQATSSGGSGSAAANKPDNQKIRDAINALEDLYESVANLQSIDAVINTSTISGSSPLPVEFDALQTLSPDNTTLPDSAFHWDFGDGRKVDGQPTTKIIYKKPGTYVVTLKVDSPDQKTILDGITTAKITVKNPESYISLFYNEVYPIIDWQTETNKEQITVTLAEAQAGIRFNASGSRDKFYAENSIKNYKWDFGDKSEENFEGEAQVTHKYAAAGNYPLTLEITDDAGNVDRKIVNILVKETAARLRVLPSPKTNADQELTFDASGSASSTGQIVGYKWSIESVDQNSPSITDFPTEREDTIKYTFKKPGKYRVKVEVENNVENEKSEDSAEIEIASKPPVAQFRYTTPNQNQPNIIDLDATFSSDPDGDKKDLEYKWGVEAEPGDYSFEKTAIRGINVISEFSSVDATQTLKFNKKGNYAVNLTVRDKFGQESKKYTQRINVDKILGVTWDDNMRVSRHLRDGEATINFRAQSENATAFELRFGDQEKESGEIGSNGEISVSHTYKQAETYDATLIVFDEDNAETIISRKIFIGEGSDPIAVIRLGKNDNSAAEITSRRRPLTANRQDLINFDASESINLDGSGRRLEYKWDFGEGNISTKKQLQRKFKELSPERPGYFPVKLTVTDKDSRASDTATAYVSIEPAKPFFLGLTASPRKSELTTPVPVQLNIVGAEDPDGEIIQYRWWYYDVSDPDRLLGQQITSSPSTVMNIGTKGAEGEEVSYNFDAEVLDNENYKFTTADFNDQDILPNLTVTNGPNKQPKASFTVDRTNINVGDVINFSSSSSDSDGKITHYVWDIEGDGFHNNQPTTQSTISHTFKKANPNGIKVKLRVIDNNFAESVSTPITIYVDSLSKPPVAAFTYEQPDEKEPKIIFTNNSTADNSTKAKITSTSWDFDVSSTQKNADSDGDGIKDNDLDSKDKNPEFTYPEPGIYRVKLTIEDSEGNTDQVVNFVNVKGKKNTGQRPDPLKGSQPAILKGAAKKPQDSSSPATPTEKPSNKPAPKPADTPKKTKPVKETPPPDARLLTNPATSPDNKIHLTGTEAEVTFDFTGSVGDIVNVHLDKNIYFDTNGNGKNDDDQDYRTSRVGTWRTNFKKSWGRTRVRLTVEDSQGRIDKVEKDIVFDEPKTSTTKKPSPFFGPSGRLGGNVMRSISDLNVIWLFLGTIFAIISLSLLHLRKGR